MKKARNLVSAFFVMCVMTGIAFAADDLELPSVIKGKIGRPVRFEVRIPKGKKIGQEFGWVDGPNGPPVDVERVYHGDPDVAKFRVDSYEPGKYVVIFWLEGSVTAKRLLIEVGESPKPPTPPTPPNPPTPPTPPTPDKLPFVGEGLKVLITFSQKTKDDPEAEAVFARSVRDYLKAKCAKDSHGVPYFRIYDVAYDLSGDDKTWRDAMNFQSPARTQDLWIYIGNGKDGTSQKLPTSADETLKLLQKYGG